VVTEETPTCNTVEACNEMVGAKQIRNCNKSLNPLGISDRSRCTDYHVVPDCQLAGDLLFEHRTGISDRVGRSDQAEPWRASGAPAHLHTVCVSPRKAKSPGPGRRFISPSCQSRQKSKHVCDRRFLLRQCVCAHHLDASLDYQK
jgi:hypothetical protein